MTNLDAFKAYDVRGRIPDEINESLAYDIGRAYAAFIKPSRVAVGYDIRLSSPALAAALKRGMTTWAPTYWISAYAARRAPTSRVSRKDWTGLRWSLPAITLLTTTA